MTDLPSSTTPTRWDRRRERTHRRLLEVAESLFRTQGFDATTVEEIAAAADVAKGTFFNYFSSKEALLGELLYARIEPLLVALPEAEGPAVERIWGLLLAVREELAPYVDFFPRMFAYALSHPSLHESSACHTHDRASLASALAQLVQRGQKEGVFRPECDPEVAGGLISTYFFRLLIVECIPQADAAFSWEEQVRAALTMLYAGLAVPSQSEDAF